MQYLKTNKQTKTTKNKKQKKKKPERDSSLWEASVAQQVFL